MAERVAALRLRVRAAPITDWRVAALATAGLVLVAVAVRVWLTRRIPTPWILVDEIVYSEYAKSFAAGGHFLVRGQPGPALGRAYPAVISPAWHFGPMGTVYEAAKTINVAVMTLVVVPVFLWARRLVSPLYATVAAVLTLALPAFVYTGALMTENVFFPVFVLALYALALVLERPTVPLQLFMLVTVGLAVGVRVQAIVLVAVVLTALLLKLLMDLQSSEGPVSLRGAVFTARPYMLSLVLIVAIAVAYVLWKLVRGVSITSGLGAYAGAGSNVYSAGNAFRWVTYHFAELTLLVGVIPVSAFIVLFGLAWARRGGFQPAERAFLATTAAGVFWLVVEVGIFASRFSLRIEERNMFAVAPLLLLALVLWLHRGLPRPPVLTAVAIAVPAALLLTLPLESFLNISIVSDTFGLIPFWRLTAKLHGGTNDVRLVLAAGSLAAGIAFAVIPKRLAAPLAVAAVVAFLVGSSYSVFGTTQRLSQGLDSFTGASDRSWIDHTVGPEARVAFLFGGTSDPLAESKILWETEFWNRSVSRVYSAGLSESAGLPYFAAASDPRTGRIAVAGRTSPQYVVALPTLDLAERRIASTSTLILYRVRPPIRLDQTIDGISTDNWMGSDASLTRYVADGKAIRVTLSRKVWTGPDVPGRVRVTVGPAVVGPDGALKLAKVTAVRAWTIHSGAARTFTLDVPQPPYRVELHIGPTFSPAQFGLPDTRQLGAQVQIGPAVQGQ